ncbi:MAG: UDP-N-acetylmuramate--L-alanine ligase [Lachnospiraceae bacterium]|nr:UDP-N-acetylmuramate--L-alanine ligase [Lachnospiraceae bacterium]
MYQIDFNTPVAVHFIGIGGISMSGLAEILLERGFSVSGSDARDSELTQHLAAMGARIAIGQCAENICDGIDVVVYTAAIRPDNPEYQAVIAKGIPMLTRAELLGQLMKNYPLPIAVAGTHGKTTTTSMVATVFLADEADPTITVGGILPTIGSNIRTGKGDAFIAEACEYTNSFLSFFPKMALILNVDEDHLDFFKNIHDIADSFHRFAALLPKDGTLIINRDTREFEAVTADLDCEVITYALENESANYTATSVSATDDGGSTFTCLENGQPLMEVRLHVPGLHNVSNALGVIACARRAGIATDVIAKGLAAFAGTKRRFEKKGVMKGVTIIDDYAHHPTEIKATLASAATYPHRELYVAFQPHTYTRTNALLKDFAEALKDADHVLLADIYAAREKNTIGITSDALRVALEEKGCDAVYLPTFDDIENYILTHCVDGDLLITMGAGDIVEVGENLLS